MFKTIFGKQFALYIGNLLVVFALLGVVLTGVMRNYFFDQKQQTLTAHSQRIAEEYINTIVRRRLPPHTATADTRLQSTIEVLHYYVNASSFVSVFDWYDAEQSHLNNVTLRLIARSENLRAWEDDIERINYAINNTQEFDIVRQNGQSVVLTGTMQGIFDELMMVVSYPIIYRGHVYGIVFMNSPISEIEANIREVVNLALLCLLLSIFVAFILVYVSSRTISRPIRMISGAAKVIAAGNFDRRLVVKSRDEVGALAESFNEMAESLERQETSRREFISNISHDLRSPLTSVKGYIQAMLDGTIPEESRDKYLQVVLDETRRVTKMANDLLLIGQFQNFNPGLDKSQFDINELIRTTLITFERLIQDKNIHISVSFADEKNIVLADCEKIQRVIHNLIDNAVKFTPHDGEISLRTHVHPKSNKITVSVKDSGPGIPNIEHKKIFDRFYKSDQSRGQDKTGTGLGLAIVKEFVRAHGATIQVLSAPGQGSEFSFSLELRSKD